MTTALTIVSSAMRKIAILQSGEAPTADEQADGLELLNDILNGWSASGYLVPYRTRDEALAVPSASNSYSLGTGGDFNTARPTRIFAVTITSGASEYVLPERGVKIYNRNVIGEEGIPEFYYYEPTFPLGTLYFPTKLGTGMTVTIDSLKPFTEFALISTDISFPHGYVPALKAVLAIKFATEFGVEAPGTVMMDAEVGMDFIRTQARIHRKQSVVIDPAVRSVRRSVFNVINDK